MSKVRTQYDNLKVARDAPLEVIRAAYKTLAQKYHPDRNPGDEDAQRIMVLVNTAYEILSDAKKRSEHDEWIKAENREAQDRDIPTTPNKYPLHWMSYIKKYVISKNRLDKAVASGFVKGSIEDGSLFLEDKPPYGPVEYFIRRVFKYPN